MAYRKSKYNKKHAKEYPQLPIKILSRDKMWTNELKCTKMSDLD